LVDVGQCRDFDEVYHRTKTFVRNTLRGRAPAGVVDDLVQGVYVTMARKIDADGVPEPLVPYLLLIVVGELRNYWKAQRRSRIDGPPDEETAPSSWPNPEQAALAFEVAGVTRSILAELEEPDRNLLQLAHMKGLTLREIGEILGRPEGSVGAELSRARAKARRIAQRFPQLFGGSRRK
jgi:RNA polymerase sigma factor (sigma-70 family)